MNEAGKSTILKVLAALIPHDTSPALLAREKDYPCRLLTQYDSSHGDQGAVANSTTWELFDSEIQTITDQVGNLVLNSSLVTVIGAMATTRKFISIRSKCKPWSFCIRGSRETRPGGRPWAHLRRHPNRSRGSKRLSPRRRSTKPSSSIFRLTVLSSFRCVD